MLAYNNIGITKTIISYSTGSISKELTLFVTSLIRKRIWISTNLRKILDICVLIHRFQCQVNKTIQMSHA